MHAKLTMPLAFLALLGCAQHRAPPESASEAAPDRATASTASTATPAAAPKEPAPPPAQTLHEADLLYDSQLGATRGGKFEVDRQVAELQRAVLLYKQFIERADGQPELQAAVRKSRERIQDACQTIGFLLGGPDGKPLAAPVC